jgi:glycerol uptake facilitator protein
MNKVPALPSLQTRCLAELIGTYILVFFGCGSVHAAVLTGAQSGLWQVAIVWSIAIMLAIYTIGGISGCHINPAITLAFATWGRFERSSVLPYIVSQLAGAILAAITLFFLYNGFLAQKEEQLGIKRGGPGSVVTASCYGEYAPNPGLIPGLDKGYDPSAHAALKARFPHNSAFLAEVLGTAILAFVVFAVTDERNSGRPAERFAPVFIGLTVAVLISVLAPLTQACFNPARDFGPRLVAYFAGWGQVAISFSDFDWLTVYIIAPTVGAIAGGGFYEQLVRKWFPEPTP